MDAQIETGAESLHIERLLDPIIRFGKYLNAQLLEQGFFFLAQGTIQVLLEQETENIQVFRGLFERLRISLAEDDDRPQLLDTGTASRAAGRVAAVKRILFRI